jgi:hypothetical protein
MINDLLIEDSYKDLTSSHLKQLIEYLHQHDKEFNLTANLACVEFEPQLPQSIYENLGQFTMFSLMNYTFSTLDIKDHKIQFEAGFGAENFGSVCTIPYTGIFQIGIEHSILFINPVATKENNCKDTQDKQREKSMNAFKKKL